MTQYSNMWQDAQEFMEMFWTPPAGEVERPKLASSAEVERVDSAPTASTECIQAIARCYE